MRRRLTVTGASSTIDGTVKPGIEQSGDLKKYKGGKDSVSIVFAEFVLLVVSNNVQVF